MATAPEKLHIVVIFHPPGQLGILVRDGLLYSFPEDGSSLLVYGEFNISSGEALCCRLPLTTILIWSQMTYHYKHSQIKLPA